MKLKPLFLAFILICIYACAPQMRPFKYDNSHGDFIEVLGDFESLQHPEYEQVNIMAGYWATFGEDKNVLLALIWIKASKNQDFAELDIRVNSNNAGIME